MDTVKVFQIGLGDFGRHGFEKLVEIAREFEDVEIGGVCDKDPESLENAEDFASANNVEVQTFREVEELYRKASEEEAEIMIYDAGPADTHAENVFRSMRHDFFHLAEKPPSLNRGEHIKEKRLAEQGKAMWMCDFIERESPVVKKAIRELENKRIDSIEVFRESSVGVEMVLDSFSRMGVKGGDILDKMVHEIFVLDFIEASGGEVELNLGEARARYFQPVSGSSERFKDIYGGRTGELNYETASAMTKAEFTSGDIRVKLNSSWLGLSEEALLRAQELEELTGHRPYYRSTSIMSDNAYVKEEARFFVVEGEKDLAGDLLRDRLFDLETGEELEVPEMIHDQLYRVLEKAVFTAGGRDVEMASEKEIDVFMNAIFDVKESIDTDMDYYSELSRVQEKVEGLKVKPSSGFEEAAAG